MAATCSCKPGFQRGAHAWEGNRSLKSPSYESAPLLGPSQKEEEPLPEPILQQIAEVGSLKAMFMLSSFITVFGSEPCSAAPPFSMPGWRACLPPAAPVLIVCSLKKCMPCHRAGMPGCWSHTNASCCAAVVGFLSNLFGLAAGQYHTVHEQHDLFNPFLPVRLQLNQTDRTPAVGRGGKHVDRIRRHHMPVPRLPASHTLRRRPLCGAHCCARLHAPCRSAWAAWVPALCTRPPWGRPGAGCLSRLRRQTNG